MIMLLGMVGIVIVPRFQESTRAREDARQAEVAQKAMTVIDELQTESGLSGWALAGGKDEVTDLLHGARAHVDATRKDLLDGVAALPSATQSSEEVSGVVAAVAAIDGLRADVDNGNGGAQDVYDRYMVTIDTVLSFVGNWTSSATAPELLREGVAIGEFLRAKDQLARQRGSIVQRLQADSLTIDDFASIDVFESREAAHTDAFKRSASPEKLQAIEAAEESEPVLRADDAIDLVRAAAKAGSIPQLNAKEWWTTVSDEVDSLDVIDDANFDEYLAVANRIATQQREQAIAYLVFGIVVSIGTAFAAVALGRALVRGLATVAGQARSIAEDRLPEVLDTLRNPTPEALANALPQVAVDSSDEIGVLATAFNAVLRTSVETSIDHAQQRARTVTNMLVNLGRRNQSLIDRQLELMDELESRQEDPDVLERLFRIDHLVTRMRRNAENLVVLAGQSQARAWSEAVLMSDVLRGAASEAPDLSRVQIDVAAGDDIEMAGPHAVDVSHLIAELVENAVSYSAPTTTVSLRTERSPQGMRIWIVDSGVGMTAEELVEANERLASPPDIDTLTTDRVGFQVVGRLARQLGASAALQANPGGGLAACVTLPMNLFELTRREGPKRGAASELTDAARSAAAAADDAPAFRKVEAKRRDRTPDESDAGAAAAASGAPAKPADSGQTAAMVNAAETAATAASAKTAETAQTAQTASAPTSPADPTDAAAPKVSSTSPAEPSVTNSGLVKRTPGSAFAGNDKAAAADAGAFRRLPVPGEEGDEAARARRFQQISQLQSAVVSAREDAEDEAEETR